MFVCLSSGELCRICCFCQMLSLTLCVGLSPVHTSTMREPEDDEEVEVESQPTHSHPQGPPPSYDIAMEEHNPLPSVSDDAPEGEQGMGLRDLDDDDKVGGERGQGKKGDEISLCFVFHCLTISTLMLTGAFLEQNVQSFNANTYF